MTNGDKINSQTPRSFHILIAPLDWGLGHATRCIPIINFLLTKGFHVAIAASGPPANLLRQEFPTAEILPIPNYRLRYSAGGSWRNAFKIFFQLPKILISIKRENQWLDTIIKTRQINILISDCRFGLHHKDVFCVLMTHQLAIQSPLKWVERWFKKWNYHFINRFNECWVPDQQGFPNLAGEISHPSVLPSIPARYIGCLSRFDSDATDTKHEHDLAIILSGPEPQRSLLENKLIKELSTQHDFGSIVLVRGLPNDAGALQLPGVTVFNHLPATQLKDIIVNSKLVISRSGYTSVMDIIKLGKMSVLIPTPGQPEQEYLGKYLSQQQWCATMEQHNFSLAKAVRLASTFAYRHPGELNMELYKEQVMQTIDSINKQPVENSPAIFAP